MAVRVVDLAAWLSEEIAADRLRRVPEFPGYLVSRDGTVWSFPRQGARGGVAATHINRYGYPSVRLWRDNRTITRTVHRLVGAAYLGPLPEGYETRHLDGDRTNPRLENLAYGTKSENRQDTLRHGTDHNARKTHCAQNHPYDEATTRLYQGRRYCLRCERQRSQRRHAAYLTERYGPERAAEYLRRCPGFDEAWRVP